MKPRLWIPDFLKGLSIIFMVQDHIFETWIQQDLLFTDLGSIIRFLNNFPAAGIFMLTMGFTAGYTEATSSKLFNKGLKVFFWGFLLNIGLNLHFFIRILTNRVEGSIINSLFAVDIFYLAGLSLIILAFIRVVSNSYIISLLLAFAVALLSPLITEFLTPGNNGNFILAFVAKPCDNSFFPIFPWLSYSLAGYGFSQVLKKYPKIIEKAWWHYATLLFFLVLSSVGFILNWNDLSDLATYYHHGIKVFVWILSVGLGLTLFLNLFQSIQNGTFSAWVQFIGSKLTRFYIVQWLIIGNMASFFYQELNLGMYFLGSLMVLGFTTIIIFLLRDFKFKINNA